MRKSPREIERAIEDLGPSDRDESLSITIRSVVVGTDADEEYADGDLDEGERCLTGVVRAERHPDGSWTSERERYDVPNDRLEGDE
jgi:hypothetical protein